MRSAVEGFNKSNGAEESVKPPSDDEFEDMLARLG
jgi:hypothetical protein